MASPNTTPPNTITISVQLLALLVTAFLAVAGWGGTLVGRITKLEEARAEAKAWQDAHEKEAAQKFASLQDAIGKTNSSQADNYARQTAQNAAIQETMTNVRIQLASRR